MEISDFPAFTCDDYHRDLPGMSAICRWPLYVFIHGTWRHLLVATQAHFYFKNF